MGIGYAERHIKSLSLARACAELGAHIKSVSHITGLPPYILATYVFDDTRSPPRGRMPDSYQWFYHKANFIERVEASIFASIFSSVLQYPCETGEALVIAYQLYRERCTDAPRISFDRAFDIVSYLKGIWAHRKPHLSLQTCSACKSKNLTVIGEHCNASVECLFCKLVRRYASEKRMRLFFPERDARQVAKQHMTMPGVLSLAREDPSPAI